MVKLSELKPSADELAAARSVLDKLDTEGRKSRMASMVHFLKTRDGNGDAMASRGQKRQEFLALFQVQQMLEKLAKKGELELSCSAARRIGHHQL